MGLPAGTMAGLMMRAKEAWVQYGYPIAPAHLILRDASQFVRLHAISHKMPKSVDHHAN